MTARPQRRRVAKGFTLIELLVALSLLALISVILTGALRIAHSAWARADAATDRLQRDELAMSAARRALQQAYPLAVAGINRPRAVAFSGNSRSVVFLAPPTAALGLGGLQLTWLTIEPDGDDARLVLRWRRFDRANESWPADLNTNAGDIGEVTLAAHVGGAELAYFGVAGDPSPQAQPQWQRDWTDAAQLPVLVSLAGSDAWPDLIVALHVGGSTGLAARAGAPVP